MGERSEVIPELFDYGIQTEASDIRAHVSVVNKTIYVFPTRNGIMAAQANNCLVVPAYQPGVDVETARGWKVEVGLINDLRRIKFTSWEGWGMFSATLSTSQKGKLAVDCVLEAMKRGRFPFWVDAQESKRDNAQLKGIDILVYCRKRVQVKCDYRGGDSPLGTGNLFLQSAERNPLRAH